MVFIREIGFALAALILVRDHPLVWTAGGCVAASAIVAYVLSRSVGLPMMSDDIGDWLNPLGVGALCAESITVAISLLALFHPSAVAQPARGSRVNPLATGSA